MIIRRVKLSENLEGRKIGVTDPKDIGFSIVITDVHTPKIIYEGVDLVNICTKPKLGILKSRKFG